jgi:HSP20 family protein
MLMRWNDLGFDLDRGWSALTGDLRREMERVFHDFERGGYRPDLRSGWPRISVEDGASELRLRAEVPGVDRKDLHITLEHNTLTLRGSRAPRAPEGYSTHREERGAIEFARSLTLPCRVDAEHVTANLVNGVLELTMPKAPEERPREIQVRS